MTNHNLEEQLTHLGREWPTDETFVDRVMSHVGTLPQRPDTTRRKKPLMRVGYLTASAIVVSLGLWWAFGPQSTGNILYAQMKESLKQVQTIHAVLSVRNNDGHLRQVGETWFARGKGFSVTNPAHTRIDNGTYFWEHAQGSETASRTQSQSTDELLDRALNIRAELEQLCERSPGGDRRIDGVDLECYQMTFPGDARPADASVLDFDKRRTFIFVDPKSLPTRMESEERVDGEWQTRIVRTWEYDVPVDPKVFEPNFGDQVRVFDLDDAFGQLMAVENAVHTEQRAGLIYTIHQARRFEGGGVMIVSSVRGTDDTLQKYPLTRRMLQPGRYISDGPATNDQASPQGSGFFRLSLAKASHKGVDVEWWMMVPRGRKPDWFEDQDGRVKLELGITPRGEYAKANHADEQGVIHNITWSLALDIPAPGTMPSLTEITSQVYAELKSLHSVLPRLLNMGVKMVNDVSTQQHGSTDDVSPEQFAAATREHIHWWECNDVEFQLANGGRGGFDEHGEFAVMTPGAFLDDYSTVDDATFTRAAERPDLVILSARRTKITDAGIAHLTKLKALAELNVAETSITDEGLQHLEGMASLEKLNVEGTRVTQAGIRRLQQALPDLEIEASDREEIKASEREN